MSVARYLPGHPNGNLITRKIQKPVPEDSSIHSQEIDEIETGPTEARVLLSKGTDLLSTSFSDLKNRSCNEHEWRRSVKSAERIGLVS
ncbi:MAG: hypothetical protein HeimC2_16190 [Candidatus Heimdallarchaeota archaeon LC_2]|nr:MAG: hypothetical protein HeimC2_16190 [Candidatus Heimdallarchaeota archaeon LC_2]